MTGQEIFFALNTALVFAEVEKELERKNNITLQPILPLKKRGTTDSTADKKGESESRD